MPVLTFHSYNRLLWLYVTAFAGDILGSSINNLDDLLRMPYGCGEQNMVNFAPNIFVMKYLKTVNQLTPAIQNKAEGFMIAGEEWTVE